MKPSAGKAGTNGCFMVEVNKGPAMETRVLARRFLTKEAAKDFYDRTLSAHQQKANRERVHYLISLYETATPKSTEFTKVYFTDEVKPH